MLPNAASCGLALFPDTFRVAGWRLVPLSLGHALLLERLGSPFAAPTRPPGRGDLALAVLLCCQPCAVALRRLNSWRFRASLRWLCWRLRSPSRFARAVATFQAYLDAAREWPTTFCPEGEGKLAAGTPFLVTLMVSLMAHLHYSYQAAIDTPLAAAVWMHAAWAEQHTAVTVARDIDLAMREQTP